MRKTVMIVSVLLAVALAGTAIVYGGRGEGQGRGERGEGRGPRHELMEQLTEAQREELHGMVMEMRGAGASREEIHAAVRELLAGWGIELPERPGEGRGEGRGPRHEFMEQLTDAQREKLHQMVTEMREAGASREEIHAAVRELLAGWGIELPEHPGEGRGRRCRHEIMEKLTGAQREELHGMVRGMREAGASREEIHAAVRELLAGWGIELPDSCGDEGPDASLLISPQEGESATWGEVKGKFR
jgi:DNA-binding transcriptional regulator YhcF (GntR family)